MSNIKCFPNNIDEFTGAEPLMRFFHGRTSGVWGDDKGACRVLPWKGHPMHIQVGDGGGWLANGNGDGVAWWNDSGRETGYSLKLELAGADPALDRIDRVVVSWPTIDYAENPTISILQGKPSSSPLPPTLTNDSSKRQISLARVHIKAGALDVSDADITDERLDPEVCGIVTENVSIDTSMMQRQFSSLLGSIQSELANIVGGTGFDPVPIRIHDVQIPASAFSTYSPAGEETGLQAMGYTHRAAVAVDGALSTMTPYVTMSLHSIEQAGVSIANEYQTYTGGVYIYADGKPEKSMTALTIELRKAVV